MIVRPALKEDIAKIVDIERMSFLDPWKEVDYLREFEENEFAYINVAEQDGILGFIDFWILFEQGTISKIAVLETLRNKHIGSVLLCDAMERMFSQGVTSITLEVRVSNVVAHKFYEKHGFKIVAVRKNYYSNGEDAYLMLYEKKGEEANG